MTPLQVCHNCDHRERPCSGPCRCTADSAGRDILELSEAGTCPLHLFPSAGLGDTVAKAVHAVTLGAIRPCSGCNERRKLLNRLLPYDPPRP